jgi:transcription antitermination factor NusG
MKKWYVITYPTKRRELIFEAIKDEKFDIKPYCPMVKVAKSFKGIVKMEDKSLFFNYMFFLYDWDEIPQVDIKKYLEIRHLYFNGKPAFITGKEIQKVKRIVRSQNSKFDRIRDDVKFLRKYIGQKVLVRDGAFTGLVGIISDARHKGKLVVELMIFSRPISCEVSVEYVEFIRS